MRDRRALQQLFDALIVDLKLRPIGAPLWHEFPSSGGITGLYLLSESHLACHTFPEYGSLCLNLFCCVPRAPWKFEKELRDRLKAGEVSVRSVERFYEFPGVPVGVK